MNFSRLAHVLDKIAEELEQTNDELILSNRWFPHGDLTELELRGFAKALDSKGYTVRIHPSGDYPHELHQIDPGFTKAFQYAQEWVEKLKDINPHDIDYSDFARAAYESSFDKKAKPQSAFKKYTEQEQFLMQSVLGLADEDGNPTQKARELGASLDSQNTNIADE